MNPTTCDPNPGAANACDSNTHGVQLADPEASDPALRRPMLRHPFDTATGTLAAGALLTAVLVALVRQVAG